MLVNAPSPINPLTCDIAELDVAQPALFASGLAEKCLQRLRLECPIHFCRDGRFGSYWSITRYADITAIEEQPDLFSSAHERGGISIAGEPGAPTLLPMFIAMDPPEHNARRRAMMPAFSKEEMERLATLIRSGAASILDAIPQGEVIDWVDLVSVELTAMTLATLLDFPQEARRDLVRWSNAMTALPGGPVVDTIEQKLAIMNECFDVFFDIWRDRKANRNGADLISLMLRSSGGPSMTLDEYRGHLMMVIVAGNETTRHSISGSVVALNHFPDEFRKLRARPELVESMVSEAIRWQTPAAHMRRTATRDIELGGRQIGEGDKVVLWYLSGNRDEAAIERAGEFLIDRANPRRHLSFGHGIHRCIGARLAELQLRIVWEEILKRFRSIELAGDPVRTFSTFIHGFERLPVIVR